MLAIKPVIISITGSSSDGKSSIMYGLLDAPDCPPCLVELFSLTTRAPAQDPISNRQYRFVTLEEFLRARDAGELAVFVDYVGEDPVHQDKYAITKQEMARIQRDQIGFTSVNQYCIEQLRLDGYKVFHIDVVGVNNPNPPRFPARVEADRIRRAYLEADLTIINDFTPGQGGLVKAIEATKKAVREYCEAMRYMRSGG